MLFLAVSNLHCNGKEHQRDNQRKEKKTINIYIYTYTQPQTHVYTDIQLRVTRSRRPSVHSGIHYTHITYIHTHTCTQRLHYSRASPSFRLLRSLRINARSDALEPIGLVFFEFSRIRASCISENRRQASRSRAATVERDIMVVLIRLSLYSFERTDAHKIPYIKKKKL